MQPDEKAFAEIVHARLSRRMVIRAGALAALGLAFTAPSVQSLAAMPTVQQSGGGWVPSPQPPGPDFPCEYPIPRYYVPVNTTQYFTVPGSEGWMVQSTGTGSSHPEIADIAPANTAELAGFSITGYQREDRVLVDISLIPIGGLRETRCTLWITVTA